MSVCLGLGSVMAYVLALAAEAAGVVDARSVGVAVVRLPT